jgi:hypothetical protein
MAASKPEQVPASAPVRVEIRVDGRVQFAKECYDVSLTTENDVAHFTAALHPTMVDVTPPQLRPIGVAAPSPKGK